MIRAKEPSAALTDEEIIARVLDGEKEFYELIMRRHNQRLFRICRAYIKDENEAEDILQETHIKAYEELPRFQKRSQLSTWLTRIMINESLSRIKRNKRFVSPQVSTTGNGEDHEPVEFSVPHSDTPLAKVMNNELHNILERAVDNLPEKYRVVYLMREIEDMSVAETSECLKISEVNVKVRLNRAKEMLKKQIGKAYGDSVVYHFDLVRCDRIVDNVLKRVKRY